MTTKAEREEKRKQLTGLGRGDLLKLLLEAWAELDEIDAARWHELSDDDDEREDETVG